MLEFLPREAKKPPVAFVPAEMEAEYDNGDPNIVECRYLMVGCTPASAG